MSQPIVFDLETQYTFQEVKKDIKKLRVSVVGIYKYEGNEYKAYFENQLSELFKLFEHASVLIGFNIKKFDLPVLSSYYLGNIHQFPTLDILEEVKKSLGFRVTLDSLAKTTLGIKKSGHGFGAIEYFREGELDKLKKYCLKDVEITKKLFEYGNKHGKLYIDTYRGRREIVVDFKIKNEIERNVVLSIPV